ncbi:MAG: GNAT family N-acetyltransferase [Sulfitobacter sp.]
MTPAELSALHHAAFKTERPWSTAEFETLLASPYVTAFTVPHGFALSRTVAGESELLTLAVDPAHQRQGLGRHLAQTWLAAICDAASEAFLEVAEDNIAAHALYLSLGFAEVARRPAYYARKNTASAAAIVLRCVLTSGDSDCS